MRLLQANKILLASCVVVIPISMYAGTKLKERYLAKELDRVIDPDMPAPHELARRARVVELQQERTKLLAEGQNLDTKIGELRKRMAGPV